MPPNDALMDVLPLTDASCCSRLAQAAKRHCRVRGRAGGGADCSHRNNVQGCATQAAPRWPAC